MVYTTENLYNELLILLTLGEYILEVLENLEGTVRTGSFNNIKKHTEINTKLIFKRGMTLHIQMNFAKREMIIFKFSLFPDYVRREKKNAMF